MTYEAMPLSADTETIKNEPCYFGKISRILAEEYLNERGRRSGTFLIREGNDGFRLSVMSYRNGMKTIHHYKITQKSNKRYYIFPKHSFITVYHLINFYMNARPNSSLNLTSPCAQIDDVTLEDVESAVTKYMIEELKTIKKAAVSLGTMSMAGKFAEVWQGRLTSLDDDVIVKVGTNEDNSQRYLVEEAYALNTLRHKHIHHYIGLVIESPTYLILECNKNRDLLDYLLHIDDYEIPMCDRIRIAQEVVSALNHISRMSYVHRYVKAANILLDKNLSCKLTGFGFAARLNQEGVYCSKSGDKPFPGNAIRWMALESATSQLFSTSTDVWSFGCFMIELFSNGEAPFSGELTHQVVKTVESGKRSSKPLGMPHGFYSLALSCWYPDPKMRPTFSKILDFLSDQQEYLIEKSSPRLNKEIVSFGSM